MYMYVYKILKSTFFKNVADFLEQQFLFAFNDSSIRLWHAADPVVIYLYQVAE